MFPTLFQIGNVAIHSYGFFIALGYLASLVLMIYLGKKSLIQTGHIVDLAFFSLLIGLVGARILFILTNLSYFFNNPMQMFYIWEGGLVFFGGFLTAIPFLFFYVKKNSLPARDTLDILAIGAAFGHAFGRIGCLGAGCCHGKSCSLPWSIRINSELVDPLLRNTPIHPTQIYESLALFILTFFLWKKWSKKEFPGQIALLYLMAYGIIRSGIEIFRGDSIRGFVIPYILSTSQFFSILLIAVAVFYYKKWKIAPPN